MFHHNGNLVSELKSSRNTRERFLQCVGLAIPSFFFQSPHLFLIFFKLLQIKNTTAAKRHLAKQRPTEALTNETLWLNEKKNPQRYNTKKKTQQLSLFFFCLHTHHPP